MFQLNRLQQGSQRIVIMGCDGLGALVATSLSEREHAIHILDTRAKAFDRLPFGEVEEGRIVPVIGDGTLQQDLVRASIENADIFMALSNVDTSNALAAQMARSIYQVPVVICRIDDPTMQSMYNELGLVAISATTLAAQMVVEAAAP